MRSTFLLHTILVTFSCILSPGIVNSQNDKKTGEILVNGKTVDESIKSVDQSVKTVKSWFKPAKSDPAPTTTTPSSSGAATTPLAPTNKPATVNSTLSGDWQMVVTVSDALSPDGQKKEASGNYEIGLSLKIDGAHISGEYTWAKGVCAIATLDGTFTDGGNFEATVSYNGGCCGGSKMKLIGTFLNSTSFTAKFKPDGRPTATCTTWWATAQGTKE